MKIETLLTVLGVLFFLSGCAATAVVPAEKTSVKISAPAEISSGEELKVFVVGSGHEEAAVVVKLGNETKRVKCQGGCNETVSFFPRPGVYQLYAYVEGAKGKAFETEKKRVVVLAGSSSCLNGIPFGECGAKKPEYCNSGVMEKNCAKCGCADGFYCNGTDCHAFAPELKIGLVEYPARAETGKKFSVSTVLSPNSKMPSGARYEAVLGIDGKKFTQSYEASGNEDANFVISFNGVALEEGSFDINLAVFALNTQRLEVAEKFIPKAIESLPNLEPLLAPSLYDVFAEGNDAVFTWSKVEGASEYRLYKSSEVNPAYISYKLAAKFGQNAGSGVLQGLERGTHFFVMTAADEFGNESKYSEVKSVDIGSPGG